MKRYNSYEGMHACTPGTHLISPKTAPAPNSASTWLSVPPITCTWPWFTMYISLPISPCAGMSDKKSHGDHVIYMHHTFLQMKSPGKNRSGLSLRTSSNKNAFSQSWHARRIKRHDKNYYISLLLIGQLLIEFPNEYVWLDLLSSWRGGCSPICSHL